ncbi:MAG TPA: DUF2269 family protein [Actinomycetota bacterium]|nr:DUF2269 family protein [Actinomycetota bacterium]
MTLYELFKIIHILAASAWVGGALLTQIQAARALKAGGADLEHFMWEQQKVGPKFFAPMSLIVVIAGVVMVVDSGWNFSDLWIVIGIAAFVATFITGMFVLKPRVEGIVELLQGGKSPSDPDVQPKIANLIATARIDLVVLFIVVIDMVIKPGT